MTQQKGEYTAEKPLKILWRNVAGGLPVMKKIPRRVHIGTRHDEPHLYEAAGYSGPQFRKNTVYYGDQPERTDEIYLTCPGGATKI
jgi:hypothetical protein